MRASRWLIVAALALFGCGSDATDDAKTNPNLDGGIEAALPESGVPDAPLSDVEPADVVGADTSDGVSPYSCPIELAQTLQTATVNDLHDLIVAGEELTVVDVREPQETAAGVIDGALLMPWTSGVLSADHASLPTGMPLYVICKSGGRSLPASTLLVDQGHACVFNVQGGMNAWESAGFPTVAP
jgi:rhodanese-related sulfurtransferase